MPKLVPPPVDWRLIEDTLQAWFAKSTSLPEVVWANQKLAQPAYPYGTLNIIAGPTRLAPSDEFRYVAEDLTETGEELEFVLTGTRQFTVSCQINVGPDGYNDPDCNGRALMGSAEASLELALHREAFRTANMAMVRVGPMQDLSLEVNGEWISRVQMDVEFATTSNVTERTTYIETLDDVTGTLDDAGQTITQVFDVP